MQEYVLGVAKYYNDEVLLIKKNRPEWQAGKYNFLGGKIELKDDSIYAAMSREFWEETGVEIEEDRWKHFGSLEKDGLYIVHLFNTQLSWDEWSSATSETDEEIQRFYWFELDLMEEELISNMFTIKAFLDSPDYTKENAFLTIKYPLEYPNV